MGIQRIYTRNRTQQETGRRKSIIFWITAIRSKSRKPLLLNSLGRQIIDADKKSKEQMKKKYLYGTACKGKIARMGVFKLIRDRQQEVNHG